MKRERERVRELARKNELDKYIFRGIKSEKIDTRFGKKRESKIEKGN